MSFRNLEPFEDISSLYVSGRPMRAVVIGGGTGAPVSIRTLLSLGIETSAVVAMADDGGSTGILREKADVTPPGDIRKCITAFAADASDPLVRAFKYRLKIADDHALGNLLLAALEDACGSFPEAISICEKLVDAQGHVYPSTLDHVTLSALTRDGKRLEGQAVACHSRTALEKVQLTSDAGQISAYGPAIDALRRADLIVLGPGSLFTSIIPNLLVPGIVDAIKSSNAYVVFVCSLADVQGETWGLTALEHFESLCGHGMNGLIDFALFHSSVPIESTDTASSVFPFAEDETSSSRPKVRPVRLSYKDMQEIQSNGTFVMVRDLADNENPTWHSPESMRRAMLQIIKLSQMRR